MCMLVGIDENGNLRNVKVNEDGSLNVRIVKDTIPENINNVEQKNQ